MLKLLLTVLVVVVALMIWFGKGRHKTSPRRPSASSGHAPSGAPQPMIACARCGMHLPSADAFVDDDGRRFCGAEHRRLGPVAGPSR